MADTKISAAADIGTVTATDMLPVARSGSTTAYHATMAELASFAGGAYVPNYASSPPAMDGPANAGTANNVSRGDHRHPTDTSKYDASNPAGYQTAAQVTTALAPYAPLASPAFSGNPTAPTPTAGDNDTSIATTAFVQGAMAAAGAGVSSWNTRTGAVVLNNSDVVTVLPPSSTTPLMDGTAAVGSGTTWARADHVHPTDTSRYAASNPSGFQTAAQVAAAVGYRNAADNAGFAQNQRAYVSGTALASGAFGFDRWKGGASGCTLTFTASPPSTVVTITAGSLQQVVEGRNLLTASYTLSWVGTAQGRVGAGSYAASPVSVSATAGTNLTIEFNTGTLSQVALELGNTRTTWQPLSSQEDLARCQRFYQLVLASARWQATVAGQVMTVTAGYNAAMRATPTATVQTAPTTSNATPATVPGLAGMRFDISATAAGDAYSLNGVYALSADL